MSKNLPIAASNQPTAMTTEFAAAESKALSALTALVQTLAQPGFVAALVGWLRQLTALDQVVVLAIGKRERPLYLYDDLQQARELLFEQYLPHFFQQDPVFQAIRHGIQPGLYLASQLAADYATDVRALAQQPYQQQFYQRTGWQHELVCLLQLQPDLWWVLALAQPDAPAAIRSKSQLLPYLSLCQSLCQQHQRLFQLSTAQPAMPVEVQPRLQQFGLALLPTRPYQVLQLLLQGLDNQAIAQRLQLSCGTVRNHRKTIYRQLRVSSVAELSALALAFLQQTTATQTNIR